MSHLLSSNNNVLFTVVGDFVDQLRNLNHYIETTYNVKHNPMSVVSRQEWWQFIGIMIGAGTIGKGGTNLWAKEEKRKERREGGGREGRERKRRRERERKGEREREREREAKREEERREV